MGLQEQVYLTQMLPTLVLVTVALAYVWRRTKVDYYRESMFTLRDDLFDYMWQNDLSFDLRAYRLMRESLNGAVRIADILTPLSFIAVLLMVRRHYHPAQRQLAIAISEIEDMRVREHFEQIDNEAIRRQLRFLGLAGLLIHGAYKLTRFKHWGTDRWFDAVLALGSPDADERWFPGMRSGARRWKVAGH